MCSQYRYIELAGTSADPTVQAFVSGRMQSSGLPLGAGIALIITIALVILVLRWNSTANQRKAWRDAASYPPPLSPDEVAAKYPLPKNVRVNLESPANAGVLRIMKALRPQATAEYQPLNPFDVGGTHPDLVQYIWWDLGGILPQGCQWIVYGCPALVHPISGIISAFGVGVHLLAMRLPPPEYAEAKAESRGGERWTFSEGTTVYADDLGRDWRIVGCLSEKWANAAYANAGLL